MPHCKGHKKIKVDIPISNAGTKNKKLSTKGSAFTGDFF